MNLLNSFGIFYDNLSSDGLFFFWIVIFLFSFLVFLTIILLLKNKKLTKLIKEDRYAKEVETAQELPVLDSKEPVLNINEEVKEEKKEQIIDNNEEEKNIEKIEDKGPYKKNILREISGRTQTSPIHIDRKDDLIYNNLREETLSPLEEMEDSYEVNDNMKFASQIVERMEEEIKPSNIELTDYEKKQEEEAIISYDELLKVKDKIYNITEDEETDEFIDELKSFRLDL